MFSKKGLVLAGLAAYAYYKYNKMSETERRNMVDNVKAKGKKLYDEYVPEEVKKAFGSKKTDPNFGEPYTV